MAIRRDVWAGGGAKAMMWRERGATPAQERSFLDLMVPEQTQRISLCCCCSLGVRETETRRVCSVRIEGRAARGAWGEGMEHGG